MSASYQLLIPHLRSDETTQPAYTIHDFTANVATKTLSDMTMTLYKWNTAKFRKRTISASLLLKEAYVVCSTLPYHYSTGAYGFRPEIYYSHSGNDEAYKVEHGGSN